MSGEVVAAPVAGGGGGILVGIVAAPLVLPLLAVGAAGVVAYGAYGAGKIIKGIVDARVEAAVQEMEAEKARICEWQAFQTQQQQQQKTLERYYNELRDVERRLAAITLVVPIAIQSGGSSTSEGYASVQKTANLPPLDAMRKMLQAIGVALDDSPKEFRISPDSPYPRLKQYLEKLTARLESPKPPLQDEIISFRDNVIQTISGFMEDSQLIAERSAEMAGRLDRLLSDILKTIALSDEPSPRNSLHKIKNKVMELLEKHPVLKGNVEALEQRVEEIRTSVETRLVNGAFRTTLADSISRNLQEMGYEMAQTFPDDPHQTAMRAYMKIPGGERLRITVDRNNSMVFKVMHEASSADVKLTAEDKRHFRSQEKRWCQDMKQLIRRMIQEGFSYTIGHEAETQIEVVVVEDANEIIARQQKAEEEMRHQQMRNSQVNVGRMS
jgi:hypothetical protein